MNEFIRTTNGYIEYEVEDDCITLHMIEVQNKGQGYGSALMSELLKVADTIQRAIKGERQST